MKALTSFIILFFCASILYAQSGRRKDFSESFADAEKLFNSSQKNKQNVSDQNEDEIVVDTQLVMIPVQVSDKKGKPITNLKRFEFRVFENGIEQEIEYFSSLEQPFTVALVLDTSYSTVFKISEIQDAAKIFIGKLRPEDKVMIVSFDKEVRVLCKPTNNQKVLRLAIDAVRIGSGTSLFSSLDLVLNQELKAVNGRKAIVLLSDGVDTSSKNLTASDIENKLLESDTVFYALNYDTYDDVQKSRRKDARIVYDEDDRPYIVETPRQKGEKESDYENAADFLKTLSNDSGGRVYKVNSMTNLYASFDTIAAELRNTYSIGYYPKSQSEENYYINVRVYRPNLKVRAKKTYINR